MDKISNKIKESINNLIKWTAAEYSYLKEFRNDLKELKTHVNDLKAYRRLKEARTVLKKIGKIERKVNKYSEKVTDDVIEMAKNYPESLKIKELEVEENVIKVAADSILRECSYYTGNLKKLTISLVDQFDLLNKPKMEKIKIIKEIDNIINNLIKEVDVTLEWIFGLIAGAEHEKKFIKKISDNLVG